MSYMCQYCNGLRLEPSDGSGGWGYGGKWCWGYGGKWCYCETPRRTFQQDWNQLGKERVLSEMEVREIVRDELKRAADRDGEPR